MITEIEKQQIIEKLQEYCNRYESQNKAAKSLKDVSSATISQALANNWELISDEMWRNLAAQTGYNAAEWVGVETSVYKKIKALLADAQKFSNVFALTAPAGSGKTFTQKEFQENNKRTYLVCCNEFWNRKLFLQDLLSTMGKDSFGTVGEMMQDVVKSLKKQEKPLLILDEADKLSDQVLYFFITLYNQLEDSCGMILSATDHLDKRIRRGLKLNRKGYNEIYSRIGRRCIDLKSITSSDIASVCIANGVTDKTTIKEIVLDSENDLRRVKRMIHAKKMSSN